MEEKQINKWLRRRFTGIGWTLIGYYLIMNILAMLAVVLDTAQQMLLAFAVGDLGRGIDTEAIMGNAWGYILAIAVGLVILHAWKGRDYWSEVLAKEKPMAPAVFLCVISLCAGAQLVNSLWISLLEVILNQFGLSVMTTLENVSGASDTFSMFLYTAVLAPIAEEILFRGYVLRTLRPFGKRFAVFGSAFLFGLFHGNLLQTPYAFLVGLVLGYVTVEYSILWAVALHMFNNLVLADLLTRLTSGLPEMAAASISLLIFGGFALAALAILIAKRGQVREYRQSEWMDRRCLKCFFSCPGIVVLIVLMVFNMILMLFV